MFFYFRIVTQKFHEEYKPTDNELKYKFVIGSSMKATQIEVPPGGLNQIPGSCTVRGDIRLTPFFDFEKVKQFVEKVVSEIDVSSISSPGYSKFSLPEEDLIGKIELTWIGETWNGVAVDMESKGYKALKEAVELHHGKGSEFAITGSLPLIGDLKKAGYDVQICGFGRMDAYHAKNEYGVLSEFHKGFKILSSVIEQLSSSN